MRTLEILIHRHDVPLYDSMGYPAAVRKTTVDMPNGEVYLRDVPRPHLRHRYQAVKLKLQGIFFKWTLRIPENLQHTILWFINNHHRYNRESVDSYTFACRTRDIGPHSMEQLETFWKLTKLVGPLPPVGSVLFFVRGTNEFLHAAVYIGKGLTISVWGAGGNLEVATIRNLQEDFEAGRILVATPR